MVLHTSLLLYHIPFTILHTFVIMMCKLLWQIVNSFCSFSISWKSLTSSLYVSLIPPWWTLLIKLFDCLEQNFQTIVTRNNIVWKYGPENSDFFYFTKICWKALERPVVSAQQNTKTRQATTQNTLFLISLAMIKKRSKRRLKK